YERTFARKFRELILAYKMELILSKEQILEMYLNQIYFGQGAYGVGAASLSYFGKTLPELNLAESAFLAGLPKSPNNYSPFRYPERARKRQLHVLDRMVEAVFITEEEREEAEAAEMDFRRPETEQIAPYFLEHVRQHLMGTYGEDMVYKGGLEIYTTLNVAIQQAAEQAVHQGLLELDKRQGWRGPLRTEPVAAVAAVSQPAPAKASEEEDEDVAVVELDVGKVVEGVVVQVARDHVQVRVGREIGRLPFEAMQWARRRLLGPNPSKDFVMVENVRELVKPGDVIEVGIKKIEEPTIHLTLEQTPLVEGGLVAVDPRTGAIRAMVGGYDFARSEYNRAIMARRQPGSAFKPIVYASAINKGLSPATQLVDAPVVYAEEELNRVWKPENYEKRFFGIITLRDALIHSRNLATVRLVEKIGLSSVVDFTRQLGITSPLNVDLSLALGSSSLTLLEITSAYGVFANQGLRLEPFAVSLVEDADGQMLEQKLFEPQ
ncbi:MAG: transglycosylase domain-containing protein, partial [Nitrospirales bacterium]